MTIVLCYTVFLRQVGFYVEHVELFWSFKRWLAGDWGSGREILGNIAMFVPFGFLLAAALPSRKRSCFLAAAAGVVFSCAIEFLQYTFMRGVFEFDDIVKNLLGAVFGYLLYKVSEKLTKNDSKNISKNNKKSNPEKYTNNSSITTVIIGLGVLFVLSGALVCIRDYVLTKADITNTPRSVCFQTDKAELNGKELTLTGFAFFYGRQMEDLNLILKSSKTGKEIKAAVQYGLPRPDVDSYFRCEQDFSKTGFTANAVDISTDEEYELFINKGMFATFSTGVYVTGNKVHYVKQEGFVAPEVTGTDLKEIVNEGYLLLYRPDRSCYVYQYKGHLYWIADKGFEFEENGATYIQYHLWTTQMGKLPQKRLKNNWFWDNIGGYFEKHEITKQINCGRYRVSRRKLPDRYSVTSILTGYYKKGKWIWRNYFRPVYEF